MNNGFSKSKEERSHFNFIMSTSGGIGPSAAVMVKRLASLIIITDKQGTSYSVVLNVLRCQLSFSLVDSAIMCVRGGRSSFKNPARGVDCPVLVAGAIAYYLCTMLPYF